MTDRLDLRPASVDDIPVLFTLISEGAFTAAAEPDSDRRLTRITDLVRGSLEWWTVHGYGVWMLEHRESGQLAGYFGLRPRRGWQTPEILYGLAPAFRGFRLVNEVLDTVLPWLFERDDITGVWAVVDPPNTASIRVLEYAGLQCEERLMMDGLDSMLFRLSADAWRDTRRSHP